MEKLYTGKTKDVYKLDADTFLLKFKDDATGANGVFDPGANTVGVTIEGLGRAGIRVTEYYYTLLEKMGIPTHFVSADADRGEMKVRAAQVFGQGLEIICRYRAVGSFFRRYGAYCQEGQPLDAFVEVTLKDDAREDPPITKDALAMLGILTSEEYEELKALTVKIGGVIKDDLAGKGAELYDIKFEFGRARGKVILIDEITGGNMRAYKNGASLHPLELAELILAK